ncbi:galactose-specific cell agglutination protein gsf2 isoform X2 [Polypterus senegalus]|uniref:galactose-specific cell agglutination protein gsf2 isoform X2 n=1 Tax=Polypterus senegalus TaxID=55291 RepID=UPI001963B66B|nr:galactose-specific cell agglutination protein gsf2 isoform X2 [Polypterus senegalus]
MSKFHLFKGFILFYILLSVGTILVSAQVMNTTTTLPTATSIQGTDVTSVSTATTAKVNSTLMMDNYTTSNTTSGIPSTPTTTTTIPPGLFIRQNNASYTAGCSKTCAGTTNICRNSSQNACTMECCATPRCLFLNGTTQETPALTTAATQATTTIKPTTIATNGKMCHVFTCTGETCYKGQTPSQSCAVGYNYCELKKKGTGTTTIWSAACSNSCQSITTGCTSSSTDCLQECCTSVATTSCLKLDGTVNIKSGVDSINMMSLLKILLFAMVILVFNNYSLFI